MFPRLPLVNGMMGAAPHFPNTPMMPGGAQGTTGFRLPPPGGAAPVPLPCLAPGPASANQGPAGGEGGDQDVMSTAQRSMLKWEKEETLGEMATVAPVLYCNTNFPQLKEQYPGTHTHTHTHLFKGLLTQLSVITMTADTLCVCVCVSQTGPPE